MSHCLRRCARRWIPATARMRWQVMPRVSKAFERKEIFSRDLSIVSSSLSRSFFTKLYSPPCAEKEKAERTACGHTWRDDYKWLEEGDERLRLYLQDETEYAKRYLKGKLRHLEPFRKQVRKASVPVIEFPEIWWPYEYWTEPSDVDPDDQAFYRRNLEDPDQSSQLLVDTGSLEDDYGQTGVGGIKMSPCQKFLAMLTEFNKGSESYTIHILDLEKEIVLEKELIKPNVSGCEWSSDSKKIIYTTHDEQRRPHKARNSVWLWVHELGTAVKDNPCLMEESDIKYYLHVGTTKSRKFIVVTAASKMSSEVHLLSGSLPEPYEIKRVQKREPGLEYFVESWRDQLIILANNTPSGNYALNATSVDKTDKEHWKLLIDANQDYVIEDLEMNRAKCVLLTRSFEGQRLKVLDLNAEGEPLSDIPLPDWCKQITLGANLDYNSDNFCFFPSSPIHRPRAYEYNFSTKECLPDPHLEELEGFCSDDYVCTTDAAIRRDGMKVPVTIVYKRGMELNGEHPCLFEVYGAYGHALDLGFQPHRTPLLTHGWILTFAHVRGGGEFGRLWHKEGRLDKKHVSVDDCIVAIDYLMKKGYTSEGRIVLESFSAGGVIAGTIINRFPSLFLAAILQVPFLDILTVLTDEKQPLTVHEYEEWGNPNQPADFKRIRDLCPYQNITAQSYPGVFVSCGFNDSRVPVWGPAKWVAKLKENQKGDAKIFLHTDFEGGHYSSESERNALRDLQYAFLMFMYEQYCQNRPKKQAITA